ncbi:MULTISPECIES: NAD-dependent epimerase/dehydratase family protein [unclassified Sphingomonas]|uniref:NAD-dependent epimerase/dehydratase family protein n=1 Tax=unclassified Sphingomonas TaxID=196159 RepID=UPI0006F8AAB9|nr:MULTISPECIES: NAD(P)H-binding protein [unclassified Sphingomonas]KQM64753.1 epimerase [Sphingomonas sp. Leaf16]KQN16886.1 epimerase [Sphingomonas sp. Leaf29]KQN22867.1 epimerase [Sphingomonas sp. Leaf32]
MALTGGTGFVGRRVIAQAVGQDWHIRALTRRAQPAEPNVNWVRGALDKPDSLAELMAGADVVLHVAGVVSAPDLAGFTAGNVTGTQAVLDAAQAAGVRRFVHVSSLSAREPQLSTYGASKRAGEELVATSDRDWTIVRPTGVYGPGDTEMRDMFRMAQMGLALLPPPGKVALVAVDDLARLLLTLAERNGPRTVLEVDDGRAMTHAEMARLIGAAVGRRVLAMHLPAGLLRLGARIDGKLRGARAKLTLDRAGYLAHPDWTADPARRPPADLWQPRIDTARGLADTAAWYRAHRLL